MADSTSWLRAHGFVLTLPEGWWTLLRLYCDDCDMEWEVDEDPTLRCFLQDEEGRDVGYTVGHCPQCGQEVTFYWPADEMEGLVEPIYRRRTG